MKQFQSRLDELYEGLHLKKTYIPETEKPDFKNENSFKLNFILSRVYSMVDIKVKQGRNEDVPDKEKLADYEKFFKDILYTIDSMYADKPRAPFTPEGTVEEDDLDITSWAPDKPFKGKGDIWTGTPPGIPQKDIGGEGTFEISADQSTIIVSIDDVEDRIEIGPLLNLRTGKPMDVRSSAGMIRIRARLETLLRKMGYDVEAPNKRGKYEVRIYWKDKTGDEIDTFKLVRKSRM